MKKEIIDKIRSTFKKICNKIRKTIGKIKWDGVIIYIYGLLVGCAATALYKSLKDTPANGKTKYSFECLENHPKYFVKLILDIPCNYPQWIERRNIFFTKEQISDILNFVSPLL